MQGACIPCLFYFNLLHSSKHLRHARAHSRQCFESNFSHSPAETLQLSMHIWIKLSMKGLFLATNCDVSIQISAQSWQALTTFDNFFVSCSGRREIEMHVLHAWTHSSNDSLTFCNFWVCRMDLIVIIDQ